MEQITVALVGAGNRGGDVYARYLRELAPAARLVALADPDALRRDQVGERNGVPAAMRFSHWQDLLERGRVADALVIATPDVLHVEPALAALAAGYHLLLEKPIAPGAEGVEAIARAASEASGTVTVAHVLRYSELFATIKRLLDSGRIGELVSIQHTENIGYWHFAHSYVRGNWRSQAESSPMILAKACHDLDLLRWLVGEPCLGVASYGGLHHFRRENAPAGSTDRCTGGCAVERSCPYSAIRIYEERFGGQAEWPNSVMGSGVEPGTLRQALDGGPYGRCVYRCDNDVADHQVVALSFGGGVSATLTVSAFTEQNTRTVHLMGTHGEVHAHMARGEIVLNDFSAGSSETIELTASGQGHSEADAALVGDFVARLRGEVTGPALTDVAASIESHRMAFAAEESRRQGRMIALSRER